MAFYPAQKKQTTKSIQPGKAVGDSMNKLRPLFVMLVLLALALFPLQAAQAQGLALPTQDGGVIIGSSYVLKDGETLTGGMVVIGGSALLETGSIFYGDLVVIGGSSTIEEGAEVNGAVVTIGGSLTIDTEVKGDVVSIGGPTLLENNTHIRGDLVTIGGPVQKTEGAQVDGELIDNPTPPTRPDRPEVNIPAIDNPRFDIDVNPFWEAFWLFARSIGYGLLAMLIVLFLPQHTRRVSECGCAPTVDGGRDGYPDLHPVRGGDCGPGFVQCPDHYLDPDHSADRDCVLAAWRSDGLRLDCSGNRDWGASDRFVQPRSAAAGQRRAGYFPDDPGGGRSWVCSLYRLDCAVRSDRLGRRRGGNDPFRHTDAIHNGGPG
jgi:hypothetical protein